MEYSAWSRVAGGFTVPSLTPLRAALTTQCLEYDDMELSVQSDVGMNITTGRGRGGEWILCRRNISSINAS